LRCTVRVATAVGETFTGHELTRGEGEEGSAVGEALGAEVDRCRDQMCGAEEEGGKGEEWCHRLFGPADELSRILDSKIRDFGNELRRERDKGC